MEDAPEPGPRWWRWTQWALIALFLVLLVLSMFDNSLAWTWSGLAGLVILALGLTELFAPAWFIDFRRRFVADAPRWQRRVANTFDSAFGTRPRKGPVRLLGAVTVVVGAAFLAYARYASSMA
jgi:hypothetical protein